MNLLRRRFLGSSLIVLGNTILDALTTPLARWGRGTILEAATLPNATASSPVTFVDVAREAGLNIPNVWGDPDHKRYIIEAKGSGLAFFDYDNDGWLDIYLTNGTRLNTNGRRDRRPRRTSTRTIATAPSPTLPKSQGSRARAGRPASASATTTTMVGTICSAASGDTTFCFTTTVTARSQTSRKKRVSTTKKYAGVPAAPGSTTTATGTWICSSATTFSSIPQRPRSPATPHCASGKGFPSCAAPAA